MNFNDNAIRLRELDNDIRRLIELREGIAREIADCRAQPGQNTRRREDRLRKLETEYASVQQRILDLDRQRSSLERNQTSFNRRII